MNKSGIEWADHTWNPITGCLHNCPYCYARTMSLRFAGNIKRNLAEKEKFEKEGECYILKEPFLEESGNQVHYPFGFAPTYHRYRMDTLDKLKMGNNVFVGAMADIFGEWIPEEWIFEIFEECRNRPHHNYMFLTKNPMRYMELAERNELPEGDHMWYGTTVTDETEPFFFCKGYKTFLSIEPLLGQFTKPERDMGILNKDCNPDWIIIGAETGNRKGKIIPDLSWIKEIVIAADTVGVPVFMNDSLVPIVGEKNMRREFPKELQRHEASEKMRRKIHANCMDCKKEFCKNSMVTLTARINRRGRSNSFGHMCKDCFRTFCIEHGVEIPELDGLEKESE